MPSRYEPAISPRSVLCVHFTHTVWIVIVVQVFGIVIHIVVGPSIVGLV